MCNMLEQKQPKYDFVPKLPYLWVQLLGKPLSWRCGSIYGSMFPNLKALVFCILKVPTSVSSSVAQRTYNHQHLFIRSCCVLDFLLWHLGVERKRTRLVGFHKLSDVHNYLNTTSNYLLVLILSKIGSWKSLCVFCKKKERRHMCARDIFVSYFAWILFLRILFLRMKDLAKIRSTQKKDLLQ